MMYCEFVEGTGCKDNEYNRKVFDNLEAMYMNTNMSKSEIYEYGKKLVDNSKSEAELKLEAEVKAEIEMLKNEIVLRKHEIAYREECKAMWKETNDKEMVRMQKTTIDYEKRMIKEAKARIKALEWVLA